MAVLGAVDRLRPCCGSSSASEMSYCCRLGSTFEGERPLSESRRPGSTDVANITSHLSYISPPLVAPPSNLPPFPSVFALQRVALGEASSEMRSGIGALIFYKYGSFAGGSCTFAFGTGKPIPIHLSVSICAHICAAKITGHCCGTAKSRAARYNGRIAPSDFA